MNIPPGRRLPRSPQTTQNSPSSRPLTTTAATNTDPTRLTSWDSAHWQVGTLPLPSSSAGYSEGNGSLLPNTGAFAGVIVGVSVSCLVIIAFLIYQIKHTMLKAHTFSKNGSNPFQPASSANSDPIKLPPHSSPDHTPVNPPDHTSSNPFLSTRRSSRRTVNRSVANSSNDTSRSGPLLTPPDTTSDRNGLDSSQRSEQASLSHPKTRSPTDLLSSGPPAVISNSRGRGARASVVAGSSASPQATVPRPLPFPSHSPSPYSSNRASLQPSTTQNNSTVPSPLSGVFPSNEKRRSRLTNDGVPRVCQTPPLDGEYPIRYTVPSTDDDNLDAEGLRSPFRDPPRAVPINTLASPTTALRDSMINLPSTDIERGNAPSSWRSPPAPFPPRPMSVVSDPFNHRGFEVPNWIDSDPYSHPGQDARATASIYSVAQRSVAASSKILPSDTSLRTLTPEPSEDNHSATLHVAVLTRFRTSSIGQAEGAIPGESVEGDGPESYSLRISGGAERRGWGTEDIQQQSQHVLQQMTSSGSRARPRLLHMDSFSPETVQPALALSGSTTTPLGAPLSAEFEARGLGRSFIQSLIGKIRWSSTTAHDRSRLPTIPQEVTRGPEGVPARRREDSFEVPRASTEAASSNVPPNEVGHGDASSIRSTHAELGWIEPHTESANMQSPPILISEPVGAPPGATDQDPGLSVATGTQDSQPQPQLQPPALLPIPAPPSL